MGTKGMRAPLVRRHRRCADADAARRTNVVPCSVRARPRSRLKLPRHIARAHAPDIVDCQIEPRVQVAHEDALGRGDARVDVPGAHGACQVVDLGCARRRGVSQCQRLKETVGIHALKGPVHVVITVGVDQVSHAHGRVATHGQRDRNFAQYGVAPVWQRRALGAARILQKVHLTIDNRKQRLWQIVLLHRGLRHLGRSCNPAQVPARIATMRPILHEHAQLLIGLQRQAQIGRGCGVRLLDALTVETLLGDERATLVVVLWRKTRTPSSLRVRIGQVLGDARARVHLRGAHAQLGAQHDDATRNSRERRVQ